MTTTLDSDTPVQNVGITVPDTAAEVATGGGARKLSVADLLRKPVRTATIPFGDTGAVIKIKAIGSKAYDDLQSQHLPTPAQLKKAKDAGDPRPNVNEDTFPPALTAACSFEPVLTEEQTTELFASDAWAQGELLDWYFRCQRLCQTGLDVPFSTSG